MNCLFLVHNHRDRGSYFRALEIARRFADKGHSVQFAFTSDLRRFRPHYHQAELRYAEMPCYTFINSRQEGWSLFDNAWRIRDAITTKWDLVYGFSHKPCCVLPALASKLRSSKVLLDWADWWGGPEGLYQHCVIPSDGYKSLPEPLRWLRRGVFAAESLWEGPVYNFADLVTLISEEFYAHPGAPKNLRSKSHVMHSGAPLQAIRPMDKAIARQAFGLQFPADAVVLGYVANFHMDEALLMEAFARLCRLRKDVHLVLAGAPLEATTPQQHEATIGRIHHVGWQPFSRMQEFLGMADILVLPLTDVALDRARYPHKLSDYVAAGRPIIACDVGETGRLLRRFNFGVLAAPTEEGFSGMISQVADARNDWSQMGMATREAAEKYFDWDQIVAGLMRRIDA